MVIGFNCISNAKPITICALNLKFFVFVLKYMMEKMTTNMFHWSYILPGSFLIHDLSPGLQLD